MNLNHQDIQAILQILDSSAYNELSLENKDFSLYLKRDDKGQWQQNLNTLATVKTLDAKPDLPQEQSKQNKTEPPPTEEGLIDVRSPMVGTFYSSPQPGAESFVNVGDSVEENTIIAIIEVMKLMSSIPAKAQGEIREILVKDAQLIEKGQLIMRVKPNSP